MNALLYNADSFFTAEVINLEEDMEGVETSSQGESGKPNQLTKRISVVELEIANLKDDIKRRKIDDSLVTSRIREELDFFSNTRKEDRIIVSGLTSRVPMPIPATEKKKWLKDLVSEILEKIQEKASEHIVSVMQGWKGKNTVPVAEVKMDSSELASKIRKEFAIKKKAGQDFGKVFMANSVTLGTRVRIEILRAVAKNFASDGEVMYVTAFTSRPLLHVRPKDSSLRPMAYTFTDAMTRFGQQMRQNDLGEAYRRAGFAFKGQLQQNFVVLHDTGPPVVTPWIRKEANTVGKNSVGKRKMIDTARAIGTPEKKIKNR